MVRLDGKVAIVTGAGRGLGRAYALRLARLGASVAVCDLDLKSYQEFQAEAGSMTGETTVDEIEALGVKALGFQLDVTDPEAVSDMVAEVVKSWNRVDILVCNAGGGRGRALDTRASALDPSLLHLVMSMNLYGTIFFVNAVAPIMKAQRSGKIITVSSIAARQLQATEDTRITRPQRRR